MPWPLSADTSLTWADGSTRAAFQARHAGGFTSVRSAAVRAAEFCDALASYCRYPECYLTERLLLFPLGLVDRLADLADVRNDPTGLALEGERLPKRVRHPRSRPSRSSND